MSRVPLQQENIKQLDFPHLPQNQTTTTSSLKLVVESRVAILNGLPLILAKRVNINNGSSCELQTNRVMPQKSKTYADHG